MAPNCIEGDELVRNYEIGKVTTFRDKVFMRSVPLKVGDKSIPGLTKSIAGPVDSKTISHLETNSKSMINEMRLRLTLPLLRNIDNDEDKRKAFFRNNTKFLEKSYLNMFVIDLVLEQNERLEKEDINYLNYILTYELNGIYVMPIVRYNGMAGRKESSEEYEKFVRRMLESKNEMTPGDKLRVGISIPAGFPGPYYNGLFSLYEKEEKKSSFVLMDFANRRYTDLGFLGNIKRVMQFFQKKGKEEGEEEDYEEYYLYGFNVKPYKRAGEDIRLAEDMCLIEAGFNSIGHQYGKRMRLPKKLLESFRPTWRSSRTFWPDDYKYHNLEGQEEKSSWDDWVDLVYGNGTSVSIPVPNNKSRVLVKRYNFFSFNRELSALTEGIVKSDETLLKDKFKNKDIPDDITKRFGKLKTA